MTVVKMRIGHSTRRKRSANLLLVHLLLDD